jgi:hypothetical protein
MKQKSFNQIFELVDKINKSRAFQNWDLMLEQEKQHTSVSGEQYEVPEILTTNKQLKNLEDMYNSKIMLAQQFKAKKQEWVFAYEKDQFELVNKICEHIQKFLWTLGMHLDNDPMWIEVPSD